MTPVEKFLRSHNQATSQIDIDQLIKAFQEKMEEGLKGKGCLPMIPTYLNVADKISVGKRKLLIDAGGTNFRSAVGYFDGTKVVLEDMEKTKMPASDRVLGKEEFYNAIADNVKRLLDKSGDIGFCFSYQVDMDKDVDGTVKLFAKEVKAPEVLGTRVGRCTLDAIYKIDETKRNIVILNDTVATLLGGVAVNNNQQKFQSYIGFIFGTGMNLCYIEDTKNITKVNDLEEGKMIINIEGGNFDGVTQGDYDKIVADRTENPNLQLLEKMISGKYLADIMYLCLEGFGKEVGYNQSANLEPFDLKDVSAFLSGDEDKLYNMFGCTEDRTTAKEMLRELIDRSARLCAVVNGAVALRVCQPKGDPVAIVAEGTTFFKLTGFRSNFEKYLDGILNPRKIQYKILQGEELNMVGTLLATMVKE